MPRAIAGCARQQARVAPHAKAALHASRTQAHAEKAKGQKETRDTSDIAYFRMRRMYRAFISTLD